MTQTLSSYIHVFTDAQVLDCSSGPAPLVPRLVGDLQLPVTVDLFKGESGFLRQWILPSPAGFSLEIVQGGPRLQDADGREIPPSCNAPDTGEEDASCSWFTLRLSVCDPATGASHAAYALVLPDQKAGRLWAARREALLSGHIPNTGKRHTRTQTVHITARNIVVRDGVSNFALHLAAALCGEGLDVRLYAHDISPTYAGLVAPLGSLPRSLRSEDILFCNYSITDEFFPSLCALPCARKVLYFHNVTPGEWFKPYEAAFAERLDQAHEQYSAFAHFDALLANSRFSLETIRSYAREGAACLVYPPFLSLHRLNEALTPLELPPTRHSLLWVGRITPHKRPELALQIVHEFVRLGVDASLLFVGGGKNDFPAFAARLDALLAALPEEAQARVVFLENLSDGQLAYLYQNASLLLCTSAHEGYCMPVAEAAGFGLPVAAMPQAAVLETLNGGGLILDERPERAPAQIKAFLEDGRETTRKAAIPNIQGPSVADLLNRILGG